MNQRLVQLSIVVKDYEADGKIVGFSIADLIGNNIWALFVDPDYEGCGIGKKLHSLMMDWYFSQTDKTVWLSTAPASRAEGFLSQGRMDGMRNIWQRRSKI